MRQIVAVFVSLLMTALPFSASASDTVSATIFLSVTIHPQASLQQTTVESLSEEGDRCAVILLESPENYLQSGCDLISGNFQVSQPQADTLLVEPI